MEHSRVLPVLNMVESLWFCVLSSFFQLNQGKFASIFYSAPILTDTLTLFLYIAHLSNSFSVCTFSDANHKYILVSGEIAF